MSGTQTAERVSMVDPFAMQFETPSNQGPTAMVPVAGPAAHGATDRAMAEVVTAQRIAIKRNLGNVLQEAQTLATAAGPKFFYRIPFKKKGGGVDNVEGPTIGCAMAAVNIYGNCRVEAVVGSENQTHWTFYARFVDYEKGVTVMRSFQQRKGQNTGMKDADRAQDLIYQIGQSKAIRNVVIAALGWLTDEMETAAKSGIVERIGRAMEPTRKKLIDEFTRLEIGLERVERTIGRKADKWLAPDMARIWSQLVSIKDGMAEADDLFPTAEQLADEIAEASAQEDLRREREGKQPDKPANTKPRQTKPKEDPKPPAQDQTKATTAATATQQQNAAPTGQADKPTNQAPAEQQEQRQQEEPPPHEGEDEGGADPDQGGGDEGDGGELVFQ